MPLRTVLNVNLETTLTKTVNGEVLPFYRRLFQALTLSDGGGVNQADKVWVSKGRAIGTGGENLDLAGVLLDDAGAAITFTEIKVIMLLAALANPGNVLLGGAASAQFVNWVANSSDILTIRPGGGFLLWAPDATAYAVTATTADLLKVAASSGTVTYDIALVGA